MYLERPESWRSNCEKELNYLKKYISGEILSLKSAIDQGKEDNEVVPLKERKDFKSPREWASRIAAGGDRCDKTELPDLYRYYGGLPLKYGNLAISKYQPTNGKDQNMEYVAIIDREFKKVVIENYIRIFKDCDIIKEGLPEKARDEQVNEFTYRVSGYRRRSDNRTRKDRAIGRYFISKGEDENGVYLSYYDVFDTGSKSIDAGEKLGLTKRYEIYDRIYEKDFDRFLN